MASLGSFGTKHADVEETTFEFFEHTLRVNPALSELELADFLEVAAGVDESNIAQAIALLKDTFRLVVHGDDFDTFWSTAKRERQGIQDLMGLFHAVIESVAERPTQGPSDSSDGPPRTISSLQDGSSTAVIARLEREGRPSVAVMVRDRQRSLASA